MVDKSRLSLNDLRRAIKEERGRISKTQERRQLETELLELRRGQRPGVQLVRRLGRGLRVTGKKVGGAISRQAQRIAEQQERQRIATQKARRGTTIRKKKKRRSPPQQEEGFFGGSLDLGI